MSETYPDLPPEDENERFNTKHKDLFSKLIDYSLDLIEELPDNPRPQQPNREEIIARLPRPIIHNRNNRNSSGGRLPRVLGQNPRQIKPRNKRYS